MWHTITDCTLVEFSPFALSWLPSKICIYKTYFNITLTWVTGYLSQANTTPSLISLIDWLSGRNEALPETEITAFAISINYDFPTLIEMNLCSFIKTFLVIGFVSDYWIDMTCLTNQCRSNSSITSLSSVRYLTTINPWLTPMCNFLHSPRFLLPCLCLCNNFLRES